MNAGLVNRYFVDNNRPFTGPPNSRAEFHLRVNNARYPLRQQASATAAYRMGCRHHDYLNNTMGKSIPIICSSTSAAPPPRSTAVLPVTFIVRKEIWLPDMGELQVIIPKIRSDFIEGRNFKRQSRVTLAVPSATADGLQQPDRRRASSLPKDIHTSNYRFAVSNSKLSSSSSAKPNNQQQQRLVNGGMKRNCVVHRSLTSDSIGERNVATTTTQKFSRNQQTQPKSILRKQNTARQQFNRTAPVYPKKSVTFLS